MGKRGGGSMTPLRFREFFEHLKPTLPLKKINKKIRGKMLQEAKLKWTS